MKEHPSAPGCKRHRFPPALIGHAVWRYCRFALSSRDVAERLAARGVVVADETIRQGCLNCGPAYAHGLRRRRPRPGDTGRRDEAFVASTGAPHDLWRAVDRDGDGLDLLVRARRDKAAATIFPRRLLKGPAYVPRVVLTDRYCHVKF